MYVMGAMVELRSTCMLRVVVVWLTVVDVVDWTMRGEMGARGIPRVSGMTFSFACIGTQYFYDNKMPLIIGKLTMRSFSSVPP